MINELLKSPAGFFSFWYDLIVMENNFPRIDFIYNSKTDADYAVGFFSESKLEADDNFLKGFFKKPIRSLVFIFCVLIGLPLILSRFQCMMDCCNEILDQNESWHLDKALAFQAF